MKPAWALGMLAAAPAFASVDLNTATAAALMAELGLTRQQAISVIERREQSPFQSVDELASVQGMDAAKVVQVKPQATVSPAPAVKAKPKAKAHGRSKKPRKPRAHKAPKPKPLTWVPASPRREGYSRRMPHPPGVRLARVR